MPHPTKKDRDEITVAKSIFDEIVEFTEHEETPKEARARKGGHSSAQAVKPKQTSSTWVKNMRTRTPKEYLKDPYKISLLRDDDTGTYAAEIEEFDGCFSQGDTAEKATANVLAAAENWIAATLANGKAIPQPYAMSEASGKTPQD